MSKIEIDPNLFIKCRLCLENSGSYQIDPTMRDEISYCFEINVKPFDGFSQVICKKCSLIVSDVTKIKRTFIEKQDELMKQTPVNNAHQEKEQDKPASAGKRKNSKEFATSENKKRKTSTSSNHYDHEHGMEQNHESSILLTNCNQNWAMEYDKIFSCTMCNSQWVTKESAKKHNSKHKIIKSKYANILGKYCVVQLQKIDSNYNMTGSIDHVVYSKSRIISKGNSDYNVSYKYAVTNRSSDIDNESKNGDICKLEESSDENSSFKASEMRKRRRKRRRRICSSSSTETVVLENPNRKSLENNCINIDDTDSDEDKHKVVKVNKNISNTKMQAVSRLITATYNKYLKRHNKPENTSIEQLNRKIISIGRQIINKRGFNCTRLMKYLEHLNLNVVWLTRSPLNVTSNSNFYKIIPRHKYASEKKVDSFEGYRKVYDKPIQSQETLATTTRQGAEFEDVTVEKAGSVIASEVAGTLQSTGHQLFCDTTLLPISTLTESRSNISSDFNILNNETKKLLNANPVANPRQLPKKFITESKKDKAKPSVGLPTLEVNFDEVSGVTSSGCENGMQMPIIAFTTSLAPEASNEASSNNLGSDTKDDSNNEQPAPRIKVKSVAELMSKETLSRMQESTSVTQQISQQQQISQKETEYNFYGGNESQTIQDVSIPRCNYNEYVILDTIELPNTKTQSPITYFRSLLQVHNFTLLETDSTLSTDFYNLVKFKVLYKQNTKVEPVILCLSLFCSKKLFCMKIKDRYENNINLSNISPNWQWEILKIYRGNVVTKMLETAKKISQEVYDNTNSFLCLLKSINCIAIVSN